MGPAGAGHVPDGTLFVNLHGYGLSTPPKPKIVLASFLTALWVPEAQIPDDPGDDVLPEPADRGAGGAVRG
ncbi:hypothetical protein [Amycolatopsis coloradensis]|uniref:hypothetical protein n=1 Tax=Amycolatopsis coloradensis TaxID=76021 RepID=UPI001300D7C3|nr:hypothetical protein [Amycolatopsis coloradensis]